MKRRNGSYILLITLDRSTDITVGKLGKFIFPEGYYLYIGSALNGLHGRIKRHLRKEKRQHWHIDYLLSHAGIEDIWYIFSEDRVECLLAKTALAMPLTHVPVPGFGSSDCRCNSHLIYLTEKPTIDVFHKTLNQTNQYGLIIERLPMHGNL